MNHLDNLWKTFLSARYDMSITDETDLNSILSTGIYSWFTENGYPINMPETHSTRGLLIVFCYASHTTQFLSDSDGRLYHRMSVANGKKFSNWRLL